MNRPAPHAVRCGGVPPYGGTHTIPHPAATVCGTVAGQKTNHPAPSRITVPHDVEDEVEVMTDAVLTHLLRYLRGRGWAVCRQADRLELVHPGGARVTLGWPADPASSAAPGEQGGPGRSESSKAAQPDIGLCTGNPPPRMSIRGASRAGRSIRHPGWPESSSGSSCKSAGSLPARDLE